MIFIFILVIQYNSSEGNSAGNSDADESIRGAKNQIPVVEFLFDQFVASFNNASPKEALVHGLSEIKRFGDPRDCPRL